MPFIETRDGTTLHVRDIGTGRPVILIHGWPLNGDMWEYQIPTLVSAGYRVITYDRRGFGRSDHPATGYDYNTLANDLHSIIEQLDLQDAALAGFSMGGGEVARYLSRYGSERISHALFIGAVPPFVLKTDDNPEGIDSSLLNNMQDIIRTDRFTFLRDFTPRFFGNMPNGAPPPQALYDWAFIMGTQASPISTLTCVDSWGRTDFREDLKAIDIPCLIIHGSNDNAIPVHIAGRKLSHIVTHGQYHEYEGAGHGLFATFAERLNHDILTFLENN